jgi:tRNA A37 threonylcarbamoyladenosine synthetase subunit TsaC/SUA5/YrdC
MTMRVMHISEPGVAEAAIEAIRRDAILVQLPTVYVLLAPATRQGVAWLDRSKQRLPNKNYGTAIGDLERFAAMVQPGARPPELEMTERLTILTGAFIRCRVAPADFNSPMVRQGTHQGVLLEGPHRELFRAIEAGLADMSDPDLLAGHAFTAPLCTSCNMSGDPLGSITDWERARQFASERAVPLVIRGGAATGQAGSYPIFALERDRITIEREGPRLAEIQAALPSRLFAPAA